MPNHFLKFIFIYLFVWGLSCGMQILSYSRWNLVPWPELNLGCLALGMQSLSHRTTREVPLPPFMKLVFVFPMYVSLCILLYTWASTHSIWYGVTSFQTLYKWHHTASSLWCLLTSLFLRFIHADPGLMKLLFIHPFSFSWALRVHSIFPG